MCLLIFSGLLFDQYLQYIKLNEKFVPFSVMDLTYLLKVRILFDDFIFVRKNKSWFIFFVFQQQNYDKQFLDRVHSYPLVTYEEFKSGLVPTKGPVQIQYNTLDEYNATARMFGLLVDFSVSIFDASLLLTHLHHL